jgi:hypothetical protein
MSKNKIVFNPDWMKASNGAIKNDADDALAYHYSIDTTAGKVNVHPIDLKSITNTGIYEPYKSASNAPIPFENKYDTTPKETKFIVTDKKGKRLSDREFDTVMEALSHADTFNMETIVDTIEVPINNVKFYIGDELICESSSHNLGIGIGIDKWEDDTNSL